MPKKRKPAGRGTGQRDWAQVAAQHEQQRMAAIADIPPPVSHGLPPLGSTHEAAAAPPPSPAAAPSPPAVARRARRLSRGRMIALGGLGVTAGGAGLYALHRSRRRKAAVGKQWITLDGEVVELRKAAPIALPVPSSRPVRALLPTGRHVSHANDLKRVKISPRRRPTSALRVYGKGVSMSTTPARLVPTGRRPPRPKSPREVLGKSEGLFWGPDTPALSHFGVYPVMAASSGRNW